MSRWPTDAWGETCMWRGSLAAWCLLGSAGLALSGATHLRTIHGGPRAAYFHGWLLSAGQDPERTPVWCRDGWAMLSDDPDRNRRDLLDVMRMGATLHLSPAEGLLLCGSTVPATVATADE